jgi:hypothetical protein
MSGVSGERLCTLSDWLSPMFVPGLARIIRARLAGWSFDIECRACNGCLCNSITQLTLEFKPILESFALILDDFDGIRRYLLYLVYCC